MYLALPSGTLPTTVPLSAIFHTSFAHPHGTLHTTVPLLPAQDHLLTALITLGEGNHGFHHAFPYSYKNGLRWYQFDPTRIMIEICSHLGITYDLKHPPENEIQKTRYQVCLRLLAPSLSSSPFPVSSLLSCSRLLINQGPILRVDVSGL